MKGAAARLLQQAQASLADSRLLAEQGSANAGLLLDLALKQALASIGRQHGRTAADADAPLDTLLGFVPAGHPASVLAGRLADPRARTAALVGELLDATAGAASTRRAAAEPRQDANTGTSGRGDKRAGDTDGSDPGASGQETRRNRTAARGRDAAGAVPGAEKRGAGAAEPAARGTNANRADGPTAFEVTTRQRDAAGKDAAAAPEAASSGFWALMDRWAVDTETALALLGSGRSPTKRNTRPRFRLRGAEAERFRALQRIDTALSVLGETPDWLRRRRLGGTTAWRMLLQGTAGGAERVLHALNRSGLREALTVS